MNLHPPLTDIFKRPAAETFSLPHNRTCAQHLLLPTVPTESLVAYFKLIDLSILELNIAILHCMFSEIKNAVYTTKNHQTHWDLLFKHLLDLKRECVLHKSFFRVWTEWCLR
jgi:hypothetical protein